MPIHEKSLIRPENITSHEELVIDGVDVSGHWSTFIESRVVKDYNESLQDEIAALPGGEEIHRCDAVPVRSQELAPRRALGPLWRWLESVLGQDAGHRRAAHGDA